MFRLAYPTSSVLRPVPVTASMPRFSDSATYAAAAIVPSPTLELTSVNSARYGAARSAAGMAWRAIDIRNGPCRPGSEQALLADDHPFPSPAC